MADTAELRLLTRHDCHLCEIALGDLRRLRVPFTTEDIDTDPELQRQYGDAVPVLLLGDREIARAPMDVATLSSALSRHGIPAAEGKR